MDSKDITIKRHGNLSVVFEFPDSIVCFGMGVHAAEDLLELAISAVSGKDDELIAEDTLEKLTVQDGIVRITVENKDHTKTEFESTLSSMDFANMLLESLNENLYAWTVPNYYSLMKHGGKEKIKEAAGREDVSEIIARTKELMDELQDMVKANP